MKQGDLVSNIISKADEKGALSSFKEKKKLAMTPKKIDLMNTFQNKAVHTTWFRGKHTNFNPSRKTMVPHTAVADQVLKGWLPETPLITPETRITAFGSCFAANISRWLSRRNYRVQTSDGAPNQAYVVSMGEGMVNSFVIRQQFEWAWEDKKFEQDLWHGYKAENFGYDEDIRLKTKEIFDETDVFILTFGLSEVWYDEKTGSVFWRTIPRDVYDPERHKFRVSTVEENRDNMRAIYQLIRKHRPDAKVIFTLSPIPLSATFRDNSCLTSNSVSKSVLRVAVDEVCREFKADNHLFYWPSYEMITDVFHLPYASDRRHIPSIILAFIMTQFEHVWCTGADTPPPDLQDAWVSACAEADLLPARLQALVKKKHFLGLRRVIAKQVFSEDEEINAATIAMLEDMANKWESQALARKSKK